MFILQRLQHRDKRIREFCSLEKPRQVSGLCIPPVVASLLTCVAVLVSFPSPNATEKVKPVLKTLSTQGPKENLEIFTSFPTRRMPLSYPSETPLFANPISDYLSDVNNPSPCNVYASDFSSI
jgi:hypothetical protein